MLDPLKLVDIEPCASKGCPFSVMNSRNTPPEQCICKIASILQSQYRILSRKKLNVASDKYAAKSGVQTIQIGVLRLNINVAEKRGG